MDITEKLIKDKAEAEGWLKWYDEMSQYIPPDDREDETLKNVKLQAKVEYIDELLLYIKENNPIKEAAFLRAFLAEAKALLKSTPEEDVIDRISLIGQIEKITEELKLITVEEESDLITAEEATRRFILGKKLPKKLPKTYKYTPPKLED